MLGVLLVLFVIIFLLGVRIVKQNHLGIVETFGRFSRVARPGLTFIFPIFQSMPVQLPLAIQNFLFDLEAVTKDKVLVRLKANLIYSIDPQNITVYYYNLTNPRATLGSFVENYVRSFVATQTHEELLEKREEIAEYLINHLEEKMLSWGIKIHGFQITDIVFPKEITEAMSKVVASQRLKEAAVNEAEAKRIRLVKQAEAEKEAAILRGQGIAGERQAIVDGLKRSIEDMAEIPGVDTKKVMDFVMLSQYFDTLKEIGQNESTKVLFLNTPSRNLDEFIEAFTSSLEASGKEVVNTVASRLEKAKQ